MQAPMEPLTKRMAAISRQEHKASNALVLAKLAVILTTRDLYGRALTDFWHVHAALEESILLLQKHSPGNRTDLCSAEATTLAELLPVCGRAAHLARDIAYLRGQPPEALGPPRPAVATYLAHLGTVAKADPRTLVAHAFTQQMALLAGGQMICKLVQKQLMLPPGKGTAAFCFSEDPRTLAQRLRHTVDDLAPGLGEEGIEKVLAEHVCVFELNNNILRTFPVGYVSSFSAAFRYIPFQVQVVIAALLTAACAYLAACHLHIQRNAEHSSL